MPSQCCFWCPASDFAQRDRGQLCSSCGRPFEYPLTSPPATIGRYRIEEAIARGFYGATYRGVHPTLRQTVVLKIVPVGIYTHFKKSWEEECAEHAAIAGDTNYIARITDQFDECIAFGDAELNCHVAVLENILGPTLEALLREPARYGLTPRSACQIAVDLFAIFELFSKKERFHNDLHGGNILVRQLGAHASRAGALDGRVQAVAIDLGSIKGESLSGGAQGRLGDQQQIANHLAALADAIRSVASTGSDVDTRLAGSLRGLAEHMTGGFGAQRIMTVDDAQAALRIAISAADEPWRAPLSLHRFGDTYNAQALHSWHVPQLWFDPDGRWLKSTIVRGPLVITGMRGCGKTMLLRALHFHARVGAHSGTEMGRASFKLEALQAEQFVGLYASCVKLLDPRDGTQRVGRPVGKPFERLFVAYLRDAVQVLKHLRSLEAITVPGWIHEIMGPALSMLSLDGWHAKVTSELAFETFLVELQFDLADGAADCSLRGSPPEAFGRLAELLRAASPIFPNKYVLFLLDDVSTRYLSADMVREVISTLLFQDPRCAFRITTEAQALQRVLLSPGGAEPADPNRDYQEFDLGKEVYSHLKTGSLTDKTTFVREILHRRGLQFPGEPLYQRDPADVLGNVALSEIAEEIASSTATSADRKKVYRGLRALQAVCVGDLGDIVKLYERILQRADLTRLPVPAGTQCDCFLEHSAGLMHFLNRRDQKQKNLALAFAQASGELLNQSAAQKQASSGVGSTQRGKGKGTKPHGLRQYTKLYVRVDSKSDYEAVANELFGLLDAGVFVYDGGGARTKTRDSDPVLQFKLTYRKMLGLASFIGLSSRDRFELSGEKLRQWLLEPDRAKQILLESEARMASAKDDEDSDGEPVEEPVSGGAVLASLDDGVQKETKGGSRGEGRQVKEPAQAASAQLLLGLGAPDASTARAAPPSLGLSILKRELRDWCNEPVGTVILGRGFEERTAVSARRVLATVTPRRLLVVEYKDDQGDDVGAAVRDSGVAWFPLQSPDELTGAFGPEDGLPIVDVSGLSKPYLFAAVRQALVSNGRVGIVHTLAKDYYPRNEDLERLGIQADRPSSREWITRLGEVLVGEAGPYVLEEVHGERAEADRKRTLLASASPKNDRLLYLLERDYDAVRILVPPPTSPRRVVARAAAEMAASAAGSNVGLVNVDSNDAAHALRVFEEIYGDHFYLSGANVELGLTGSKMHAVALAALAAAAKVSAVWYVAPRSFDHKRFTAGVGATEAVEIRLARSVLGR